MKRIETYEDLPMMSDERYAELDQWCKNHDRRFFDVVEKYRHPAVNHVMVWHIGRDSELLRKVFAIVFGDLSDDEKKRRLDIIAPPGVHYM